jgi:NTP pyrophosphohydrolases containing a Zn-finger, probably nucleic-acid-binding
VNFEVDFASVPDNAHCFLFCGDEILVEEVDGADRIPSAHDLKLLDSKPAQAYYLGLLDETPCYAAQGCQGNPAGLTLKKVRQVYGHMRDTTYGFMLRAFHLMGWLKNNRFCGCCGGRMKGFPPEIALTCEACRHVVYPRISPAIIVAVVKDDKILLAHSQRFPAGRYSVLAGFVEPGETLEECVRRELQEEVGIEVSDIRYFGSQPWPFPDSLMVAFTARWSGGTIRVDNHEIADAAWYTADQLPGIPPKDSVARRLIDWFVGQAKI